MEKNSKGPGIVIGLVAVAALGWYSFAIIHNGINLPFGLHNPYAKKTITLIWRDATPAEAEEAKAIIGEQMKAFRARDLDTAISYMGYKPNLKPWKKSEMGMFIYHEFPGFIRNREVTFGPAKSTDDKKYLRVPVTVLGERNGSTRAVYTFMRSNGALQVLFISANVTGGPEPIQPN